MIEVITHAFEDMLVDPLQFRLKEQHHICPMEEVARITLKEVIFIVQHMEQDLFSFNYVDLICWTHLRLVSSLFLNNNAGIRYGLNHYPSGGPWAFVSRMRILVGVQAIEHLDSYNRIHWMTHI